MRVTLTEACEYLKKKLGVRPHYDTLQNWCQVGVKTPDGRVRLASELIVLAGRRVPVRMVRKRDLLDFAELVLGLHSRVGRPLGTTQGEV